MTTTAAVALLVAASACQQGVPPAVVVTAEAEQPRISSTYRLDELRSMARRAGHVGRHPLLGYYAATFGYRLEPSPDADCPGGIVIRLMLGARYVEVPADAKPLGCRPEAIAEHYLLHAEADTAALGHLARRIREAVGRPSAQPDHILTEAAVASLVDDLLPGYDADRLEALAAPETAPALSRLRDACSGGMPGLL